MSGLAAWLRSRGGFFAFVALLLAPLLVVSVPPLSDLPNHLARVHVLARLAREPGLHLPWESAWALLPNLAVDLPGVLLVPWLGVETFGRLFVGAAVLLWCLGCRALGRSLLGRDSVRALIASALVWSEPLLLGYAGFVFGTGLALLAVAAVVRTFSRSSGQRAAATATLAAVLGLGAAVAHVGAAVIFVASTTALAAAHARRSRGRALAGWALAALVPAGLYVLAWWLRAASRDPWSFASPGSIVRSFALPMTGLDAKLDAASLALLALLGAVALVRSRPLAIGPLAAAAALACGALVALFPSDVAGAIEVHGRFALAGWVFAIFAVGPRELGSPPASPPAPRLPARSTLAPVVVAAVTLLALRTVHLAGELRALDLEARSIRALMAAELPRGASLGTAWFSPDDPLPAADRVRALATLHVPALAVVDREAHVPTLYALAGVQPLRYVGGLPRAHRYAARAAGPEAADLARFDFVWLCGGPPSLERELRLGGELRGRIGRCALFATRRHEVASLP